MKAGRSATRLIHMREGKVVPAPKVWLQRGQGLMRLRYHGMILSLIRCRGRRERDLAYDKSHSFALVVTSLLGL